MGRVWAGPGLPSLPLTIHVTQLCRSPHEEMRGGSLSPNMPTTPRPVWRAGSLPDPGGSNPPCLRFLIQDLQLFNVYGNDIVTTIF